MIEPGNQGPLFLSKPTKKGHLCFSSVRQHNRVDSESSRPLSSWLSRGSFPSWCLKETMVEKNGQGINPWLVFSSFGQTQSLLQKSPRPGFVPPQRPDDASGGDCCPRLHEFQRAGMKDQQTKNRNRCCTQGSAHFPFAHPPCSRFWVVWASSSP